MLAMNLLPGLDRTQKRNKKKIFSRICAFKFGSLEAMGTPMLSLWPLCLFLMVRVIILIYNCLFMMTFLTTVFFGSSTTFFESCILLLFCFESGKFKLPIFADNPFWIGSNYVIRHPTTLKFICEVRKNTDSLARTNFGEKFCKLAQIELLLSDPFFSFCFKVWWTFSKGTLQITI